MINRNDYNQRLIEDFRASGGASAHGRPLLLLTTTGARSGLARTVPIMYIADGERLLVIASNAGAPHHPDWYRNLVAHPEVTVELEGETFTATAHTVEGTEREQLWAGITQSHPFFAEHQTKITRQIPVVALTRRG